MARYPHPHKYIYRVWHGERTATGKNKSRQSNTVEAYTAAEAKRMICDMFPGHVVGKPVLWVK